MRRSLALPLAFLTFVACSETPLEPPVDSPSLSIEDAVHQNGNEAFYWLPPMVDAPSLSGVFDGTLAPEVTVCAWTGSACALPLVAHFTETTGPGSETVRLVAEDELYIVNWHTDEFGLDPSTTYRIVASVDGQELGHADVDVVSTGKELKNADTGEYIALKDGRTLPIKFRIEEGALGARWHGVRAGERFTCATTTRGTGFCWGDHSFGQAGAGSPRGTILAPTAIVGGLEFGGVEAADGEFACGVTVDGSGYCWGRGGEGQLGTTATLDACAGGRMCLDVPTPVEGGIVWDSIDTGGQNHACGLDTAGAAYCWGSSTYLGDGTSDPSFVPVAVSGGHVFEQVSTGQLHACGLTASGQAYCWGADFHGQVGSGVVSGIQTTPVAVAGGLSFIQLTAGYLQSCGLTASGAAYCWGDNSSGTLGMGAVGGNHPSPTLVTGGLVFTDIAAGGLGVFPDGAQAHACGITDTGEAYCWGYNGGGQLGDGTTTNRSVPVAVVGGHRFTDIEAGVAHTCGVTTQGDIYCWGLNLGGNLGIGTVDSDPHPVPLLVPAPPGS